MMYCIICIHFVVTNTSRHINTEYTESKHVQNCSNVSCSIPLAMTFAYLRHASPLQGQGTRSSEYSFNSSSTRSWASKNRPRFGAIELRYQRIDAIFGEDPFSRIYHIIIYNYIYSIYTYHIIYHICIDIYCMCIYIYIISYHIISYHDMELVFQGYCKTHCGDLSMD